MTLETAAIARDGRDLLGIVPQGLVQAEIKDVGALRDHGLAYGRQAQPSRPAPSRPPPPAAGLEFDRDCLADIFRHRLGNDHGHKLGRRALAERHDDGDRAVDTVPLAAAHRPQQGKQGGPKAIVRMKLPPPKIISTRSMAR